MIDKWFEQSIQALNLREHIENYFGPLEQIYIERARSYLSVPVMILQLGVTERHPYKMLATIGLSRFKMAVPKEMEAYNLAHAELVMAIPADWELGEGDWPVQWLAEIVQLAKRQNHWLSWGYATTIDLPTDSQFAGLMLMLPDEFDPKAAQCRVGEQLDVHFYQATPVYAEEIALVQSEGIGALMERFDTDFTPVINLVRKNYA